MLFKHQQTLIPSDILCFIAKIMYYYSFGLLQLVLRHLLTPIEALRSLTEKEIEDAGDVAYHLFQFLLHDLEIQHEKTVFRIHLIKCVPHWYLISRVFNFTFFAIVKKSRN